ncbi:MAG TPA: zf-HC2 domain-containing protein [Acidobacteriota bacterium]|nr:zf-HC2 domain-containing protein [Acidobacteriota bacterium]
MNVRCVLWRRKFLGRIEGGLTGPAAARLDRHLADCPDCRDLFERVRNGHEAGRLFGRLQPEPPPRWPGLEEIREGRAVSPPVRRLVPALAAPILLAAVAAGLALLLSRGPRVPGPAGDSFAPLAIGEFARNTRARIVTEGFVNNVYFDEHERTLHIKLVEAPLKKEPFVICEVRDPRGLTIPAAGNRVRIYGTARYDGQPGREWHEINPVAEIAVLKR